MSCILKIVQHSHRADLRENWHPWQTCILAPLLLWIHPQVRVRCCCRKRQVGKGSGDGRECHPHPWLIPIPSCHSAATQQLSVWPASAQAPMWGKFWGQKQSWHHWHSCVASFSQAGRRGGEARKGAAEAQLHGQMAPFPPSSLTLCMSTWPHHSGWEICFHSHLYCPTWLLLSSRERWRGWGLAGGRPLLCEHVCSCACTCPFVCMWCPPGTPLTMVPWAVVHFIPRLRRALHTQLLATGVEGTVSDIWRIL